MFGCQDIDVDVLSSRILLRPADFGLAPNEIAQFRNEAVEALIASGNIRENRAALAALIGEAREGLIGDPGLDETFEAIRAEMRRFADTLLKEWDDAPT